MSLAKIFSISALFAAFATGAVADELDFYKFRTTHSPQANRQSKFEIKVLQTNLSDSDVNQENGFSCVITPEKPSKFSCKIEGEWVELDNSKSSAMLVLSKAFGYLDAEVVDVKEKSGGVWQFLLKYDRVVHVVLNAPTVVDDSMECELVVVAERDKGIFRCRSEFNSERRFEVRDVPIAFADMYGYIVFGLKEDPSTDEEKAQSGPALKKIRQIIDGIKTLKKYSIVDEATPFNIAVDLSSDKSRKLILVSFSSSGYSYYLGTRLRGNIQHVHRGLDGRQGH